MKESDSHKNIIITSPGRICLFGDHQDYLGLPVIACAINRQVILSAEENNGEPQYFHDFTRGNWVKHKPFHWMKDSY